MKNPKEPFAELKETIKHIAKLDEVKKNTIFITTKEPETIEKLVNEMNRNADSNMHLKQEDYHQLTSAKMHYFTYRIIPTNKNITQIEYELQLKKFKSGIADTAKSFISRNYIKTEASQTKP